MSHLFDSQIDEFETSRWDTIVSAIDSCIEFFKDSDAHGSGMITKDEFINEMDGEGLELAESALGDLYDTWDVEG